MITQRGASACPSCGHRLEGPYCARCGEEALEPDKLTVWYFLKHTLLPEIVNLDGKIWRTFRLLLFRPGFLAREYSAGRRRLYVKPLRILVATIIIYALSAQSGFNITLGIGGLKLGLTPTPIPTARSVAGTLSQIDRFGVLERMFRERVGPVETVPDNVRNRFNEELASFGTPLSFTTVVLLTFALYACFHRRRPLFVEHAVLGMHYFSFVLLSAVFIVAVFKLGTALNVGVKLAVLNGVVVWQFVYLMLALRRFYWEQNRKPLLVWPLAGTVTVLIYLMNALFITTVQLAAGAIAIWRL